MQIELTLNMKFMYHQYELEMARPVYYETALKKVYIFIRDYRDVANRVASNECRLVCILDTWLKIAQNTQRELGYRNMQKKNTFPTIFP